MIIFINNLFANIDIIKEIISINSDLGVNIWLQIHDIYHGLKFNYENRIEGQLNCYYWSKTEPNIN